MTHYFPQGIVTGEAFCNRTDERLTLKQHIENHEHVVLVGPRRHGKTSLIAQVLKDNHIAGMSMDFFFALTQEEVCQSIVDGVSQLISSLLPKTQSLTQKLLSSIRTFNPKLTFTLLGQSLEISTKQATEKSISEILLALDQFALLSKKTCVVVFDEFQQIGQLKENHAIEAAIRHAVERSQHVSYIFCGSNRHLLNDMFSNNARPLYHLCDLMQISRIHKKHYATFLTKMAKEKWQIALGTDEIEEIMHLTENHPYYVNALCRRLWRQDKSPSLSDIQNNWDLYVTDQSPWISNDIAQLTLNRKKVLTALAFMPSNEIQGQIFSKSSGLSPSGAKKSLTDLMIMDLIYQDEQGYYRVMDPAMAYYIRKHFK
jgi:AAA+ ATPase superfamily predicted ATPase